MKNKNIESILKRKTILIVDNIEKWINVAKTNIDYYGCKNIMTAQNPEEAFIKYKKQLPAIIFADINFDKNNINDTRGLDLIRKLREDNYQNPIAAMSSLIGIGQRTLKAGANYFIDKENFVEEFDSFIKWYKTR